MLQGLGWAPNRIYANRNLVFDWNSKKSRWIDLEIGERRRHSPGNVMIPAFYGLMKDHMRIMGGVARKLNFKVALQRRLVKDRFRQTETHSHNRKLRAASHLDHMKITI